jgi:signal transduction histidine kinase
VLALAIVSMLAAGVDLPLAGVLVAFLAGVLAIDIGAVSYGDADLGTVLGYPAPLAGLALGGRYRRAYQIQTEQAEALLAETRRAQFETEHAAALTERSRIAREIHDVLAHSLSALGIQLQATEVTLSERHDIDRALRSLASARRLVDEGLTEARSAVRALRTDAPPLPQALAALVDDRPGALTISGDPYALSPAAGLALLRVAQEAVTNAVKHADGKPGGDRARVHRRRRRAPSREPAAGQRGSRASRHRQRLRSRGNAGTAAVDRWRASAGPIGDRWVVQARVTRRAPWIRHTTTVCES